MGRGVSRFAAFGCITAALALLTLGAFSKQASAQTTRLGRIQLTFTDTNKDTTFQQDEVDTVRTQDIDTQDWDLAALMQTNGPYALPINFYSTSTAFPVNADTVYFTVEKRVGTIKSTGAGIYTSNRSIVAAAGACAVSATGTQFERVYVGQLIWDSDAAPAANAIGYGDVFRLRIAGDQGGASPVIPGMAGQILYPKRAF